MSRRKQFAQAYRMTKKTDRWIGLILLGVFVLAAAVGAGLFWVFPPRELTWYKLILIVVGGLMLGLLATLMVFSRRAERSMYAQMEGQQGAAGGALQMLRRGWKVDPAVAFTKQQDIVHRVVGRPGIILVGEGNANRLRPLMATERRKLEKVAAETPVHELIVGDRDGEVPLPKLAKKIQKLPRKIKPAQMTDVLQRLKAYDAQRSVLPMPKGPVPTNLRGMRQSNMRGR